MFRLNYPKFKFIGYRILEIIHLNSGISVGTNINRLHMPCAFQNWTGRRRNAYREHIIYSYSAVTSYTYHAAKEARQASQDSSPSQSDLYTYFL
jgi:hypothetical protein